MPSPRQAGWSRGGMPSKKRVPRTYTESAVHLRARAGSTRDGGRRLCRNPLFPTEGAGRPRGVRTWGLPPNSRQFPHFANNMRAEGATTPVGHVLRLGPGKSRCDARLWRAGGPTLTRNQAWCSELAESSRSLHSGGMVKGHQIKEEPRALGGRNREMPPLAPISIGPRGGSEDTWELRPRLREAGLIPGTSCSIRGCSKQDVPGVPERQR